MLAFVSVYIGAGILLAQPTHWSIVRGIIQNFLLCHQRHDPILQFSRRGTFTCATYCRFDSASIFTSRWVSPHWVWANSYLGMSFPNGSQFCKGSASATSTQSRQRSTNKMTKDTVERKNKSAKSSHSNLSSSKLSKAGNTVTKVTKKIWKNFNKNLWRHRP